jgi:hypothetical protein
VVELNPQAKALLQGRISFFSMMQHQLEFSNKNIFAFTDRRVQIAEDPIISCTSDGPGHNNDDFHEERLTNSSF